MKRKHRSFGIFNLSFLDVVSCGFGAIVLLLVIVKISEPEPIKETITDYSRDIAILQQERVSLQRQLDQIEDSIRKNKGQKSQLEQDIKQLKQLQENRIRQRHSANILKLSQEKIIRQLFSAKQELTEEIRRLQTGRSIKNVNNVIGGIPADSEYIIFVIDTSGSMQQFAWPTVREKMKEILEIYPQVKGIQVMNDMGDYMFSQYSGRWIRDTPARRKAVLARLISWAPFSNSSPVEGITAAIKRFYSTDKRISIYIFGDDFSRGSIQQVVDTVNSINHSRKDDTKHVRIHAVGFPVLFNQQGAKLNVARFAALMRRLAEDNDGSFVGLTQLHY